MLIYLPDANNSNVFIAKLCPFTCPLTEDGGRKLQVNLNNATKLKAVSGVMLNVWGSNLNPQQEKALAEFLSGSDVFVNLPTKFVRFFNAHLHA